jgi:hypothetical protein
MTPYWLAVMLVLWPALARANVKVCVQVDIKSWAKPKPSPEAAASAGAAPARAAHAPAPVNGIALTEDEAEPAGEDGVEPIHDRAVPAPLLPVADVQRPRVLQALRPDPHDIDPAAYLKRMLEYEVTHAEGYVAVDGGCSQRMTVELYPLEQGWTVFARYTQTGREEKVDRVELDEFDELAERVARALLEDRTIGATLTRENVLRADSVTGLKVIKGRGHFAFGMGTAFRVGMVPTARLPSEPASDELRIFTPFDVQLAYRLKVQAWGLDVFARMNLGTETTALRSNQLGGHIDYAGSGSAGLHFIRYTAPSAVNSLYFAGGAALELTVFELIRSPERRLDENRSSLVGGGLNVDLALGYEFLRASVVHFYTQLELQAPTYVFAVEDNSGALETYLPGGLIQVGIVL